jgi:hypothetical protein
MKKKLTSIAIIMATILLTVGMYFSTPSTSTGYAVPPQTNVTYAYYFHLDGRIGCGGSELRFTSLSVNGESKPLEADYQTTYVTFPFTFSVCYNYTCQEGPQIGYLLQTRYYWVSNVWVATDQTYSKIYLGTNANCVSGTFTTFPTNVVVQN